MRDSHIVYYDPPVAPADDMWGSVIVFLIIAAFIGGLIWLLTSTPPKKKDDKTLIQEIDGIFDELKTNAIMFKREEAVPSLDRARAKVSEVLRKRGLATE